MKKILSTILGFSLLTAFPTVNYAETSDSNAEKAQANVKVPPAQMKAPPTEAKTSPANVKVNEAETSQRNAVKAPPAEVKAPSTEVKTPPAQVKKAPPTEVKTPPAQVKVAPRATSRDNENAQSTPQVPQPCQGITADMKVDPSVQAFLGCDIIQILAQPERVESFRVKFKPNPNLPAKNRLGNYPIEENGQGRNLSDVEIKDLQKLFFSENSYYFSFSKRCPFEPDMGLHFVKGEQSVEVLFSFSCNLWVFFYKDEEKLEDFDRVQAPLLTLGKSLFSPAETSTTN